MYNFIYILILFEFVMIGKYGNVYKNGKNILDFIKETRERFRYIFINLCLCMIIY